MNVRNILICDNDELTFRSLSTLLAKDKLSWVADCDAALTFLAKNPVDLLLLDLDIRTPEEGLDYLPRFRQQFPELSVVMLSGSTEYESVRKALRIGALDYLSKGATSEETVLSIERILSHFNLRKESNRLSKEVASYQAAHSLLGMSEPVKKLRKLIEKLRPSDLNVLIQGEPGTGKEIVARQLRGLNSEGHFLPFVAVDSSTIHASTAEGILFGHEKGAFTGADKTKPGLFEEADGGCIYFDEIGNMSLDIQAKLLRVIQEKEVLRLGASKTIPVEFRVIAATNKDLTALCKKGEFRADLLERIGVVPVVLPALRERGDDILALAEHFLKIHAKQKPLSFSAEARATLMAYSWPGNVRELKNVIAYTATLTDSTVIEPTDFPAKIWDTPSDSKLGISESTASSFSEQMKAHEKFILEKYYKAAKGNVSQVARTLKMDRSHLHQKLKSHGIGQASE